MLLQKTEKKENICAALDNGFERFSLSFHSWQSKFVGATLWWSETRLPTSLIYLTLDMTKCSLLHLSNKIHTTVQTATHPAWLWRVYTLMGYFHSWLYPSLPRAQETTFARPLAFTGDSSSLTRPLTSAPSQIPNFPFGLCEIASRFVFPLWSLCLASLPFEGLICSWLFPSHR